MATYACRSEMMLSGKTKSGSVCSAAASATVGLRSVPSTMRKRTIMAWLFARLDAVSVRAGSSGCSSLSRLHPDAQSNFSALNAWSGVSARCACGVWNASYTVCEPIASSTVGAGSVEAGGGGTGPSSDATMNTRRRTWGTS